MHILINGSFWTQPDVGVGQYLHGLVRWLPLVAPQHRYTLLQPAAAPAGTEVPPGVSTLALPTPFDGRHKNLAKLWFEQISVPVIAGLTGGHASEQVQTHLRNGQNGSVAILHVPYFAPPLRCNLPVVTTVGDIIPLVLPEYRGGIPVRAYMALMRRALRRTTHILTFSHFSLWDIATHLSIPTQRITPTLLAADERYAPADRPAAITRVAREYGLQQPFIYYVGGLDARKNVAVLLRASALLRQQHPDLHFTLAIAGRPLGRNRRLFPDLDPLIADLGLEQIVRRITVPHADGPLLYRACTAFAFPSRYEGFGLPPLEAMACGAPVVVSNAGSLPEVVADAALCVPPDDVTGWAAALERLLRDEALRDRLREQGLARAGHFSWRRVAEETVAVYEKAAATSRDTGTYKE